MAVAMVLTVRPTASIYTIARMIVGTHPVKKDMERTRRALADLARKPWLAGEDLVNQVQASLAARKAAAEAARQERERRKAEREARRREQEERFRRQPARVLLQRLLRYQEIREEIARQVRELRGADAIWWSMALAPDQVVSLSPVQHYTPGTAGTYLTSREAAWRANLELAILRRTACLLTVPWISAREILSAARRLRRAQRKGDVDAETAAREDLRLAVRDALEQAGWADPDLWAAQILETPDARAEREMAVVKEAGLWPLPGVVDLSPMGGWPEPYRGPEPPVPLGISNSDDSDDSDDGDGVDPEIAEMFSTVDLAGVRRRGKGGAKTSFARRAAMQEGLHPAFA
ncbi:hypothetical protein G7K71_02980 [Desulfofundulus sp. TPOSR]|uniref:hypothetical protein n=1 Tax=Desulfofundulus sp. TPOSR TaxID=2714340 RepID=UPI00140C5527|nr:hypothetical protein [Desulfofundulus sp. TPOSR]NHM25991.1 hypothetical protein [Desulfofundulus sp. TPOSR]